MSAVNERDGQSEADSSGGPSPAENGGASEGPASSGPSDAPVSDERAEDGTVPDAVVDEFEQALADARRQADENYDRYLRAEADLQNVKRRSEQHRRETALRVRRELLGGVLEVADNLERALSFVEDEDSALVEGIRATQRELNHLLERENVARIEAEGAAFDPERHEAVAVVAMPDVERETVIDVERAGYTIGDELLRAARVVVAKPQ